MPNWANIVDEEITSALLALREKFAKPRASQPATIDTTTAVWSDRGRLVRDAPPQVQLELPELSNSETVNLKSGLKRHEVQGTLQALLAVRLTAANKSN